MRGHTPGPWALHDEVAGVVYGPGLHHAEDHAA